MHCLLEQILQGRSIENSEMCGLVIKGNLRKQLCLYEDSLILSRLILGHRVYWATRSSEQQISRQVYHVWDFITYF
jgi:hypothetical protein